ncbi:unnamed protein product [Linum trigynum]|uniref:SBP-type domain-containing protein n=1 Tax=Linum trigynum TaxID=586398 RepID=A0AAV2FFL3_9ROSI
MEPSPFPPAAPLDEPMEPHLPPAATEPYPSSPSAGVWEFTDLLDFNIDDHFSLAFDGSAALDDIPDVDPDHLTPDTPPPDRVRKRDPRLTCSNFLAGRVPCACPELDAQLELEREEGVPGNKRPRVARGGGPGMYRCQVPGCEADIGELKGYHRRHRVCLRCANATAVELEGETKRYCQQCGKFHLLSDFDEGKRSCRRKLERHNNRRRRKPGAKVGTSVDSLQAEDAAAVADGEAEKEGLSLQVVGKEALVVIEDEPVFQSEPQKLNSDSGAGSAETQLDAGNADSGGKYDSKLSGSPSYFDNRTAYSSLCPTGRISFKLYDWNPAEFPRRLRHQIFQWLASMPVELEGYIRPGCTILTVFVAMPKFMWAKVLEDPLSYVHNFVIVPGTMLYGKGPMIIYLNDMMFRVMKGGTSVMQLSIGTHTPRLHYVHPMFFEAGKPMEFVTCGSNLFQSKFRLLVSFDGKYLAYDHCVGLPSGSTDGAATRDHQLCKISIPCIDPNIYGPAFIEVENESGLSNFIPVLVGDQQICSEMEVIRQRMELFDASHPPTGLLQCEVSETRQRILSELIVDIAWLLKTPSQEDIKLKRASFQIQKFMSLLQFLLQHESTFILGKILPNLKILMDEIYVDNDADAKLLQKYVDDAHRFLLQQANRNKGLVSESECTMQDHGDVTRCSSVIEFPSVAACSDEDIESRPDNWLRLTKGSSHDVTSDKIPLLNGRAIKSCSLILSNRVLRSRPGMFVIAAMAMCLLVCAVLLHPHSVSKIAVSIRSCLTDSRY